jgi:N-acetylglucosamine kinase-like BadF-type ATPase
MEEKFLLGVDGGGTKTDYGLFTYTGKCMEYLHTGSRSHEILPGGFEAVEKQMLQDLRLILEKHNIEAKNVSAAFGLAGIDTPWQQEQMEKILSKMAFADFVVSNDSILGVKAGCPSGVGVCSVNGTGTVACGINEQGETLQVGGIGMTTGDYGGGAFLAGLAINAVYSYYLRCGLYTTMVEPIMDLLEVGRPQDLLEQVTHKFILDRGLDQPLIHILMNAAMEGDDLAVDIVKTSAHEMAKSISGCIQNLHFLTTPDLVLAGSIWTKVKNPLMMDFFVDYVHQYTGQRLEPIVLDVVPMAGAVIWALERAENKPATRAQRKSIIEKIKA